MISKDFQNFWHEKIKTIPIYTPHPHQDSLYSQGENELDSLPTYLSFWKYSFCVLCLCDTTKLSKSIKIISFEYVKLEEAQYIGIISAQTVVTSP